MKEYKYDLDALDSSLAGVTKLAKAVRGTLGPRGRNVMISRKYQAPIITKDGATVARYVELDDVTEQMSAELVKDVASRTSESAGDGTTTATILTHALLEQGVLAIKDGANPIAIKRGIEKTVDAAVKAIKELSTPCNTLKAIAHVGTIAANSDEAVGNLISQAMAAVGKEGVISVEEGQGFDDELEIVEGMQIDRGYITHFFCNNPQQMTCELNDPLVLLVSKPIRNLNTIWSIMQKLVEAKRSLLLICDEINNDALQGLVVNSQNGAVPSCAVMTPGVGNLGKQMLQDIAILTGATVIGLESNAKIEGTTLDMLGTAKKVIVNKSNTTFIDGGGTTDAIANQVKSLMSQAKSETDARAVNSLKERAAKLSGGVAIIKIGATTDTEMHEKKARVEDALHATQAAVAEGIVPGGGMALLEIRNKLLSLKLDHKDELLGRDIVNKALVAPLQQILKNAGLESKDILFKLIEDNFKNGYDASSNTFKPMLEAGIVDPAKVTRSALQNAASVAVLMITTDCMIADVREDKPTQLIMSE